MTSGKHLAQGSAPPSLPDDGKLRLYSMRFCPYSQRVHLVLDAKGIPHHTVYINLTEKPDWYFEINSLGKIPSLDVGKHNIIHESLVIAEYLEEKYPQHPLFPKDLVSKAKDRALIERFASVSAPMYKLCLTPNGPAGAPGALTEFVMGLDVFEEELKKRNSPYFGGKQPGMVDYMIWPWCERADMLRLLLGSKYELDEERFQKLLQWRNLMKEDSAVKVSYISPEDHAKFFRSRHAGEDDYDMLAHNAKKQRTS